MKPKTPRNGIPAQLPYGHWLAVTKPIRQAPPMPPIRCVYEVPCGACHYCRVATLGPEYWAVKT